MAFDDLFKDSNDELQSSINTTPLVDVMLVLLIIFLITVPVAISSLPVALPRQTLWPRQMEGETITVTIDKNGQPYWNGEIVNGDLDIADKIREAASSQVRPTIHIRADEMVKFNAVGRIVALCRSAGITKIGFVTQPSGKE